MNRCILRMMEFLAEPRSRRETIESALEKKREEVSQMRCPTCNNPIDTPTRVCPSCGGTLLAGVRTANRQVLSTVQVRAPLRIAPKDPTDPGEGENTTSKYRARMREASQLRSKRGFTAGRSAGGANARPSAPNRTVRPNAARPQARASMPPTAARQRPQAPAIRPSASRPLPPRTAPPKGELRIPRVHIPLEEERGNHPLDSFNWLRLLLVAVICVILLTIGSYMFLRLTDQGQRLLASWSMEASGDAYAILGRERILEGNITQAVAALEIAHSKDPKNLEILMDLGLAYEANNRLDQAELAYRRVIGLNAVYPEPYRRVISLFLETDREYEALQCMQLAYDKTGEESFQDMLYAARPSYPRVSVLGGNHAEEFDLELVGPTGAEVRYTLDDSDPFFGKVYAGPIHLPEGGWTLRAISIVGNLVSDEQKQVYYVRKPSPDMPKTTLEVGSYSSVRTVGLRAAADVVAIYYTTDGSPATESSKLYSSPIQLRVGKTTIRAIAVNSAGKVSNEMILTYECDGKLKSSLQEKDTFADLTLFSTTRAAFEKRYGTPKSEEQLVDDALGSYVRLRYAFGYAVFLTRKSGGQPVLAELSVTEASMTGPRGVKVGMSLSDAIALFRDEGGEDDGHGNRILHNLTTGNMGLLHYKGDGVHEVRYYCKLEKDYIELALFSVNETIVRIEWLRYRV